MRWSTASGAGVPTSGCGIVGRRQTGGLTTSGVGRRAPRAAMALVVRRWAAGGAARRVAALARLRGDRRRAAALGTRNDAWRSPRPKATKTSTAPTCSRPWHAPRRQRRCRRRRRVAGSSLQGGRADRRRRRPQDLRVGSCRLAPPLPAFGWARAPENGRRSPPKALAVALLLEDVHGARGAEADHVGQADLRALDLTVAGLAAQVRRHLVDVGDAGRADRVTLGDQPARRR